MAKEGCSVKQTALSAWLPLESAGAAKFSASLTENKADAAQQQGGPKQISMIQQNVNIPNHALFLVN